MENVPPPRPPSLPGLRLPPAVTPGSHRVPAVPAAHPQPGSPALLPAAARPEHGDPRGRREPKIPRKCCCQGNQASCRVKAEWCLAETPERGRWWGRCQGLILPLLSCCWFWWVPQQQIQPCHPCRCSVWSVRPVFAAFVHLEMVPPLHPTKRMGSAGSFLILLLEFAGLSLVLLRSQCSVWGGVAAPTEGGVRRTNLSWVSVFNTVVLALPQTLLATRAKEALVCCEILARFPGALAHHQRWTVLCRMWGPCREAGRTERCRALQCQSLLDVLGGVVMHSPRRAGH